MTIMFPPDFHAGAAGELITVERRFRVIARCSGCRAEMVQDVEMVDEPHEPATELDFYESGAVKRLNRCCSQCGHEGITIIQMFYLRSPTDV